MLSDKFVTADALVPGAKFDVSEVPSWGILGLLYVYPQRNSVIPLYSWHTANLITLTVRAISSALHENTDSHLMRIVFGH